MKLKPNYFFFLEISNRRNCNYSIFMGAKKSPIPPLSENPVWRTGIHIAIPT